MFIILLETKRSVLNYTAENRRHPENLFGGIAAAAYREENRWGKM